MRLTDTPTSVQNLGRRVEALYADNPYGLESFLRTVVDGLPPGGFMSALLSNDFRMVAAHADDTNARHLHAWAIVLANWCPAYMVGDRDALEGHMRHQHAATTGARLACVPPACREAYSQLILKED